MKKNKSRLKNSTTSVSASSRRTFLKQSFAFAALTASYSVVSLSQLACNNPSSPGGSNELNYFNGSGFSYYY